MTRSPFRACKDCGTSWYDTYISERGLCQTCARRRAVEQVDAAYATARTLKFRGGGEEMNLAALERDAVVNVPSPPTKTPRPRRPRKISPE